MSSRKYTPAERTVKFWAKVDKSGGEDACWLWTGGGTRAGYGQMWWEGRLRYAPRISWELAYGKPPDELSVLHNCPTGDNPRCVNPRHLWLGTYQDNANDRERKGRGNQPRGDRNGMRLYPEKLLRGSTHPNAKLTEVDVGNIRQRFADGGITKTELARDYHVTDVLIGKIVRGESWKHIL